MTFRPALRIPLSGVLAVAGKTPKIPLMERGFKAAAREERDDQPELDV